MVNVELYVCWGVIRQEVTDGCFERKNYINFAVNRNDTGLEFKERLQHKAI